MARQDYGQKRRSGASASRKATPKRKAPPPPPPRRPWGLALIALIGLGGLATLIYLLVQTPATAPAPGVPSTVTAPKPKPASQPTRTETSVSASKPTPPAPAEPAESDSDRFQFYDMLPKSKVETPEVSAYKSTPKTAKLDTQVLLQAGSFRNSADAEQMRARMILAGLPNVTTSRTEGSNGIWYRVRTGPFDTRTDVNVATNKLHELNIQPLQVRAE
ncbi:MAG: hypothetical protein CMI01_04205 [Oceanospirillaceae bacterium]|nr:hypothetical protein [Oceanospirillaceae bacterium]